MSDERRRARPGPRAEAIAAATRPTPKIPTTPAEMRAYVAEHASGGVRCPCCGAMVEVRERPLTTVNAQGLALACRYLDDVAGSDGWLALGEFFAELHRRGAIEGKASGGDYAKLRFFGLIEPERAPRPGQRRTGGGRWGVTALARAFVRGEATVPANVRICMNEMVGQSERRVSLADVLGPKRSGALAQGPLPWARWRVPAGVFVPRGAAPRAAAE
jgi:hypothetical protein